MIRAAAGGPGAFSHGARGLGGSGARAPTGFTLVEVLVALVVLQVGLLGVVGTVLLASRTLRQAELLEWGVAEVQRAADSLLATGAVGGSGQAASGPGELRWRVEGGGRFLVEFHSGPEILVAVEGIAYPAPYPAPTPATGPEGSPNAGGAGGGAGG